MPALYDQYICMLLIPINDQAFVCKNNLTLKTLAAHKHSKVYGMSNFPQLNYVCCQYRVWG